MGDQERDRRRDEAITPANVEVFEGACRDAVAADPEMGSLYAGDLFCARVRKMRPQGACYEQYSPQLAELLDACGPERDPQEPGNTPRRPCRQARSS